MTSSDPGVGASRSASIVDVARVAGVSNQTVSRVLTGAQRVSARTRESVLRAMAEVGYVPNAAARALRRGSFDTIGVIVHQLSRTGESSAVEAIVHAARANGYTVSLVDVEQVTDDTVEAAVERLQHQLIDGLVIVRHETGTALNLHVPPNMAHVVLDPRLEGPHDTVGADQHGTVEAVRHLLGLGHATVHHLAGPPNSTPAIAREEAWRVALEERGADVPELVRGDWTPESGYAAGLELLERRRAGERVTAVLAASDEMAIGLRHAARDAGLSLPDELSIVGFDNIPLGAHLSPALTSVEQDFTHIGEAIVELLLDQIRNPAAADERREPRRRIIPTRLVVRDSTAPPASA
jgi:Transcriptional regulators